jgi:small-conductance mechanosensitive channel
MESLRQWRSHLDALDVRLFTLGDTGVTLWGLLLFVSLVIALVYIAGWFQRWMVQRVLAHAHHLDPSFRQAIASVLRYVLILVGFLVIVQAFGINLTTLNVLVGAVGVGVGFGLQNIISNWMSGLIIMFERPIRIGDRVEVGGIEGDVTEIGARRTTIVTKDDTIVIVPNSRFITDVVVNWQYYHSRIPLRLNLGVAHDADPHVAARLIGEAAREHAEILSDPAPITHLCGMTAGAFAFELTAWTQAVQHKADIVSALNYAINDKLSGQGIKLA